jgi:hypothetical protein
MSIARISLYEHELRSPRGRLDKLWWKIKTLMTAAVPTRMLDNQEYDWHETVEKFKHWADRQHAMTGTYPDGEVQKFLAKFS